MKVNLRLWIPEFRFESLDLGVWTENLELKSRSRNFLAPQEAAHDVSGSIALEIGHRKSLRPPDKCIRKIFSSSLKILQ